MYVGTPPLHRRLTSQVYEQCCYGFMQLVEADAMVHCQNIEDARYILVKFYGFFQVLAHGPYKTKAVDVYFQFAFVRSATA